MRSSQKGSVLTVILIVVAIALAASAAYLWYSNNRVVIELTNRLTQTQNELTNVKSEAQEAKQEMQKAIYDVETPLGKFMLLKAYSGKVKNALSQAGRDNLDVVIVYVEKQPAVLSKTKPQLPADVQKALTAVKAEFAKAKVKASAVSNESDTEKIGETVTLQGELEYIQADAVMGGGMFMLTDSTSGYKYTFYFDPATTASLRSSMVGKEVTVDVTITDAANGLVTYDVVSGPTLVEEENN